MRAKRASVMSSIIAKIIDLYLIRNYKYILNRKIRERERNLLEIKKIFFLCLKNLTYTNNKNKKVSARLSEKLYPKKSTQYLIYFRGLHNSYISFALRVTFCSFENWIQIVHYKLISAVITNERNYIDLAKKLY